MGFLKNIFSHKKDSVQRYQLVTVNDNGFQNFYTYDGKIYHSDIVLSCIQPYANAIGKLTAKHIREYITTNGEKKIDTFPDVRIKELLERPNPYMSGQKMQEKLANQLKLNSNAFILIARDEYDNAIELYPINATAVEALYNTNGDLFLRFTMRNGKRFTFDYKDIIHLRTNFHDNDIFGSSIAPAIVPLMEVVETIDKGIIKAIKNSGVIQWLLKFTGSMRPEDVKAKTEEFAKNYMSIESSAVGVAGVDNKSEAERIEPKDYVPNAAQINSTTQRLIKLLGTNEKIISHNYTDEEWNAYYESQIEIFALDAKNEYTYKIFSRGQRAHGNYITFDAFNLSCASLQTKLQLVSMVDRGAMTPNEWRATMGMSPVIGGDQPLRRLDTETVEKVETEVT